MTQCLGMWCDVPSCDVTGVVKSKIVWCCMKRTYDIVPFDVVDNFMEWCL